MAEFEHLIGRRGSEQVHGSRYDSRPACLVAGAKPSPVIAVKILVEQDQVAPVRIVLKLLGAAVDRSAAFSIARELFLTKTISRATKTRSSTSNTLLPRGLLGGSITTRVRF